MSGIAGIVNLDGAPVDRVLVERMEEFLHARGPDGHGRWIDGNVALVHTLLMSVEESRGERQPTSLDGNSWIVADARIDARDELIHDLASHGRKGSKQRPDAELILHAYFVWGEACVEHLLGDFAFAIWDARERKLFCARDHFGVKPFFYARVGGALIFSNEIDCPRLSPDFRWEVYEPAIADYLILGYNHDVTRTPIEAIRRLAPAHALIATDGEVRTQRYWTLPPNPPTVFHRSRDYVERFLDLFEQAVADRLRTGRVAVLMSGGLDSSSVAAMAKQVLSRKAGCYSLSAHTGTYERLISYEEGRYASLVARALNIPWHNFPLDNYKILEDRDKPEFRRPEPEKLRVFSWRLADLLGNPQPGLVVLTGQGSDGLFSSLRKRHCRELIRQGRLGQLICDVSRYLLSEGRFGRLYLRGHLLQRLGRGMPTRPFPSWLSRKLDRRLNLRSRYEAYEVATPGITAPEAAVRPEAYEILGLPLWPSIFEEYEPDHAGAAIDVRHPYFDLRLVRYVLSLPALPWCSDKELLRRSMRGLLPNEVRLRRKQPVPVDYLLMHYRNSPKPWLENFQSAEGIEKYVSLELAKQCLQSPKEWEMVVHLRPLCLNYWLKWEAQFAYKLKEEGIRVETRQGQL